MSDHQQRFNLACLIRSCIRSGGIFKAGVGALALGAIALSPAVNAQSTPASDDAKDQQTDDVDAEIVVTGLRRMHKEFGPPGLDRMGPMPYVALNAMVDPAFPGVRETTGRRNS